MESISLNLTQWHRRQRRAKGEGNFLYVRYADDFVVLCNGTKAEALAMKEELREFLCTKGLTLSEEKTKVTHITEGFRFLGYQIIREIGGSGNMVPKVLIPEDTMKKFEEVFWGMAHWLGRKFKLSMPKVMRRDRRDNTIGYKTSTLVMPTDFKATRLLLKTWHNPYIASEQIIREELFTWDDLWSGDETRHGRMDLREEVIQLKGTTCVLNLPGICESNGNPLHPSEVEIHHDPARKRFKVKTEADRMKHLHPVCTSCHRARTKTDRKGLSRMT
jgi:hypothetical protein